MRVENDSGLTCCYMLLWGGFSFRTRHGLDLLSCHAQHKCLKYFISVLPSMAAAAKKTVGHISREVITIRPTDARLHSAIADDRAHEL